VAVQYGDDLPQLDNGRPTKRNTQGGVATGDATAGLIPGSFKRDTCTYVSTIVDEYMPNWKKIEISEFSLG